MKEMMDHAQKITRREAGRIGWGLVIYDLIMIAIVMLSFVIGGIYLGISYPNATEQDAVYIQVMDQCEQSGLFYLLAIVFGLWFLFLFFRKSICLQQITHCEKKMTARKFITFLVLFLGAQGLFNIVSMVLEYGVNQVGFSVMDSIEAATQGSTVLSMFLYADIVGPVSEELIYRGIVLRGFEKYGKKTAIIVSAILFGVMHGNLPQGMFAFGIGLVLGYVAMEYSIGWSVLLHIVNNAILCDGVNYLYKACNITEPMQETISNIMTFVFGVASIVILYKNRRRIKEHFASDHSVQGIYGKIFTSVGVIVFILINTAMALISLQKI